MGSVAIGAISYIRRKLEAVPFAEVDLSEHWTPKSVVIEESLVEIPDGSAHMFYYVPNANLLIFEESTGPQVEGDVASELTKQILDVAEQLSREGDLHRIGICHARQPQGVCQSFRGFYATRAERQSLFRRGRAYGKGPHLGT